MALPGLLLAAHHQLARARGGAPVHPPQLVAVAVLPGDDVVLAGGGDGARLGSRRCPPTRRRAGSRAAARRPACTVKVSVAVNERTSSHMPNGSVSRASSGPIG